MVMAHVGSWTTSFDWNLRATDTGEPRLPFRHHIDSGQKETPSTDDEIHRFLKLPTELQQHIMAFCDPATLFWLMHVSFTTREEAQKVFWSDPTTPFVVDGQWLLAGGHPRLTNDDLEALTHIQYVEVDFYSYRSSFVKEWREGGYYTDIHEGENERDIFWTSLRRRFPCVTDVVLTVNNTKRLGTPIPEHATRLATGSPDGISIVGAYQCYDCHKLDLLELKDARQIQTIQATEAYHLLIRQIPCVCPFSVCGLQFEQPGEWLAHGGKVVFRRTDHDNPVPLPPCEWIRTAFERHDGSLELKRQRISDELAAMRTAWGKPGSSERSTASQQFLQQLRYDPLYSGEKAPEEFEIWFRYERDMNGEEHRHVY
ncbi:hypothetical protein BKA63DRAFT_536650 [Paraphoma chrysanthemicola]|nr:hypothetical protein BKA63DRAFT_536650 [Paraphoma chrysanthemicola]